MEGDFPRLPDFSENVSLLKSTALKFKKLFVLSERIRRKFHVKHLVCHVLVCLFCRQKR